MTELCAFCSSLDVRYAGYYKPRQAEAAEDDGDTGADEATDAEHAGHDSDDENNDHDNDSDHDSGRPLQVEDIAADEYDSDEWQYDEDDDYDEDASDRLTSVRSVPEMLATSETCEFCGELSRLFYRWVVETYPGRTIEDLFLADSEVTVTQGASMAAKPRPGREAEDDVSRLTSVRVMIMMRDPDHPKLDNHFYWPGIILAYQRVLWEAWPRLEDVLNSMDAREAEGQSALAVWSEHIPYSARQRSGRIDLRLLRRWKEACFAWHGGRCRSVHSPGDGAGNNGIKGQGAHSKPRMLRLVDVDDMCLVEIPDRSTVSWVVLSYVWGRLPFFTLTTTNRKRLMIPGAFSGHASTADSPIVGLPPTVADAIEATRGLDERYLWTDSLCIMQDSAEDKALFVPAMDDIYGRAIITIVDLGGANAFHGLPGVLNDRFADRDRFPTLEPFSINGTRIIRAPQPIGTGYERMDMQAGCVYLQRGWTFQEALLSRRFVLFTADAVFWECPCATWREDGNWEVEAEPEVEQVLLDYDDNKSVHDEAGKAAHEAVPAEPDIFRNSFLSIESTVVYDRLWGPTAEDFDVSYQALVHSFSRRQLSFERDGLAAFSGVLNALERTTRLETERPPLEFIWGLPGPFLGVALTWPVDRDVISELDDNGFPVTDAPPLFYRRTDACLVFLSDGVAGGHASQPTTAVVPFPSWSWVGWVGPIMYDEMFGSLLSEHAGIRFYVFIPDGKLAEVSQNTVFRDRWPASDKHVREPPLWRETSVTDNVVDARMVPEHIRTDPALRQVVLAFWTSCCPCLHMMFEARTRIGNELENSVAVWEHVPGSASPAATFSGTWNQRPPRSWCTGLHIVECIVVGRDNLDNLSASSRLVLLVTERVGDEDKQLHGTRRRVAALTVGEKEWNALQTRRWEAVVLV